jgi:hypothetical protein
MLYRVMRLAIVWFLFVVALGCGQPQTSAAPAASAPSSASAPAPVATPVSTPEPTAGSAAPIDAGANEGPTATPDASAPPAPVKRTGKTWPFHAWDRAEAVTFNQFPMRRGARLYAYNEHGFSSHIVDRRPLDDARAKKAVDLVTQTNGDVNVSKCPFPRHAVVLYEREVPVASINVCFECGDILLWPRWAQEPGWSNLTDKEVKALELRTAKQMKLYEKVFPKWEVFFRDEVGFPIDARHD